MYSLRTCSKTISNFVKLKHYKLQYSTSKNIHNVELDKIRNIGILAHIDAGRSRNIKCTVHPILFLR